MHDIWKKFATGHHAKLRFGDFLKGDFSNFFERSLKLNEKGFQSEPNRMKASWKVIKQLQIVELLLLSVQ